MPDSKLEIYSVKPKERVTSQDKASINARASVRYPI